MTPANVTDSLTAVFRGLRLHPDSGGRPPAAVELAPEGVVAAALRNPSEPPLYAFTRLSELALVAGISEPNVRNAAAVAGAIRSVLSHLSPRSRSISLVLPDSVFRVFILDFDSFPARKSEAIPILRFRLRKMVPFDVEHAALSYQILTQTNREYRVLVVILPAAILEEYEAAVRVAEYEPGAILPSGLALLEAARSDEPSLVVNLGRHVMTTAIVDRQDLLLYRSLDLPEDTSQRLPEVQRGVAVAAAYFEDKLGALPQKLFYAGIGNADEFMRYLDYPELEITDLVSQPNTGATTALAEASIAGVTGALTGVR